MWSYFFYVQAFCFFTSQFTENTSALLLKSKKSLLQGSCQTTGPTQSLGRGKILQTKAERVTGTVPHAASGKATGQGSPSQEHPEEKGQHLSARTRSKHLNQPTWHLQGTPWSHVLCPC